MNIFLMILSHELKRKHTIAHRLDTVRNADQILVMDRGRIVQKGTHKQLKGQPGIYSKFLELRKEAIGWKL